MGIRTFQLMDGKGFNVSHIENNKFQNVSITGFDLPSKQGSPVRVGAGVFNPKSFGQENCAPMNVRSGYVVIFHEH
jgi:hypothetical protein